MRRKAMGAAVAVAALVGVTGGLASGSGILPPNNPSANLPSSLIKGACYKSIPKGAVGLECIAQSLYAINAGRSAEGLGPMILPSSFNGMSVREQQWVVANLERNDRGMAPFAGLSSLADSDANAGAVTDTKPRNSVPDTHRSGGVWAQSANPLGSDLLEIYDDGVGGANRTCTAAHKATCWSDRDTILRDWIGPNALLQFMGASSKTGSSEAEEFGSLNPDATTNPNNVRYGTPGFPDNNLPGIVNLSGHQQDPGDRLIIKGVGFTGATSVKIGGVLAPDVSVQSDHEIDCTIPAGPTGTVQVVVTTPEGSSPRVAPITTITYNG